MRCEEIQARLDEGKQTAEVRQHLAACPACAAHAALLAHLRQLEPPSEPAPSRWRVDLPHPPWLWRKPATYLPLVMGAASLGYGFWALDLALPGGEELSLLGRTLWEVTGLAVGEAVLLAGRMVAEAWGVWVAVWVATSILAGALLVRWARVKVRP